MKNILILNFFLVYACALPVYNTDPAERNDPQNYKNIEILLLESAVDQDGGYSFSFENDDGSKVSQEGQHKIIDDEHAIESISGSYSYNDVNGQPVMVTYTADENGFRPVGAHLPTAPPIPLEILRSLRFLATAKPFVDEELYDYVPKKKVYRGRQYGRNIVTPGRNNDRSNNFPELRIENPSSDVSLKSVENPEDKSTQTTQEISEDSKKQAALASSFSTISAAVQESIKKTSKITQSATKETAASAIAAIREEATLLTDKVTLEASKVNDTLSGKTDESTSGPVEESKEIVEKYATIASDIVSTINEEFIETGVEETENAQIHR